ncbi:carbohydrate-binding protein [Saccharothrix isguenensis]
MADSPMGPWTPETYAGAIFKNPGVYFGAGGNNHQSVFELDGEHYFTYHAQTLNRRTTGGATQGFRSPHIAKLEFNPDGTVQEVLGTFDGVEQIRHLAPLPGDRGGDHRLAAGTGHQAAHRAERRAGPGPARRRQRRLDVAVVGGLRRRASGVSARVKPLTAGTSVQVRLDGRTGPVVATIPVESAVGEWTEVGTGLDGVPGVHDVYFTFVGPDGKDLVEVDSWRFAKPSLMVSARVNTWCAGPNVKLTVHVADNESVPVDVVVETPYGARSFDDVEPGRTRFHPFNSRRASVDAGAATVKATATVDGQEVSVVLTAPYERTRLSLTA